MLALSFTSEKMTTYHGLILQVWVARLALRLPFSRLDDLRRMNWWWPGEWPWSIIAKDNLHGASMTLSCSTRIMWILLLFFLAYFSIFGIFLTYVSTIKA